MKWNSRAVLLGSLAAGCVLRVVGLRFGLYHPDEHLILNHALAFGTGDLNPHMFYLPTFFMYLLFGVFGLFFLLGRAVGWFSTPDSFLAFHLAHPETLYVLARAVSAAAGTLTIAAVYRLGKEFRNARTGAWSALFLAVNFLHVRDSHFATMDIALAGFTVLSLTWILKYLRTAKTGDLGWAAVAAGAATATKYNGFLLALPIGLAYAAKNWSDVKTSAPVRALVRLIGTGLVLGSVMTAVFFLLSPYVFIDWKSTVWFLDQLYRLNVRFEIDWLNHLWMLRDSLGVALGILAAAGWVRSAKQPTAAWGVLTAFFAAYYVMITKAGQPYERYVLAILPIAIVWAGDAADRLSEFLGGRMALRAKAQVGVGVLILLLVLPKTLAQERLFLKANTRELAAEWLAEHVPSGTGVILDDPGECPRLTPLPEQISEAISRLDAGDPVQSKKIKRLRALLSLDPYPSPHYRVSYLSEGAEPPEFTTLMHTAPYDAEELVRSGASFVITSETSMKAHPEFYRQIGPRLEKVFEADPRKDRRKPMSPRGWTFTPVDASFWNLDRPGPLLYVYKIKKS